jgi:serine O-acetyltransferase
MSQPAPDRSWKGEGFTELVAAIVASDLAEPVTRHIDAGSLPSRDAVIDLVKKLRELLFPGYFGKQNLTSQTLEYYVGELLGEIRGLLFEQVRNVIRHQATRHGNPLCDFDGTAEAIVIFSYPGIFAITAHRIAHELFLLKVPLIPRIMSEYAHALTGIDIHPGATIGEFFFIDHGTGVVIGETTTIGRYAKIYQGVTLGALSTRGGQSLRGVKRHPTLEDGVTVYSGASILGGETVIGKDAVISSNVFVTQSVPSETRVTVKNPELQYRNRQPQEFKQEIPDDWMI